MEMGSCARAAPAALVSCEMLAAHENIVEQG